MMEMSAARHLPFTWEDYRSWDDDQRWEIIGGEVFAMSPAPVVRHQHIHRELLYPIVRHLRGHPCKPFSAPIDVKLSDVEPGENPPVVREPPGRYEAPPPAS
jgi:Uma2 family endonuclease